MTFLLDTDVVSELREAKAGRAHPALTAWAAKVPAGSLHLSVITLLDLQRGVLQIERRGSVQGAILRTWLDGHVLPAFAGRVPAIDAAVALQCVRLRVPNRLSERDAMIAAAALVHRMTLVTRNVADFEASEVPVLDPSAGSRPSTTPIQYRREHRSARVSFCASSAHPHGDPDPCPA